MVLGWPQLDFFFFLFSPLQVCPGAQLQGSVELPEREAERELPDRRRRERTPAAHMGGLRHGGRQRPTPCKSG